MRSLTYRVVSVAFLIYASHWYGLMTAQTRYAHVVEGIVAAWNHVDVVCLGEIHAHRHDSDLRIALVRHPAFVETVRIVVVEFATASQQTLLDRFILEGTALSREQLAPVWRDSGSALNCESRVYEEFFRAVQQVNAGGGRALDAFASSLATAAALTGHASPAVRI